MENVQNLSPTKERSGYKLLEGAEVMKIIKDPDFLMAWDVLYLSCPWVTVFQSPKFVVQWYSLYHKIYEPVLVYAETDGKMSGLLPLVKGKNGAAIMGAGRTDSHYQVWIAGENNKETFIQEALHLLRKKFKKEQILLEHLPPDAPIEWLNNDPYWASCCTVKAIDRPIIDLNQETITQLMKKQQFRQNRNRLKRQGDLRIENITKEDEFESILDELAINYDFRQGAVYNRTPFQSDPLKKEFFRILFKEKLLFVTVLLLNHEIIASVISMMGLKGFVHGAGINSQSSHFAKYSPGFINIIWFAEDLYQEGFKFLDLSTGGQPYKSRLASSSDTVYRFSFSPPSRKLLAQRTFLRLEEYLKRGLTRVNINPKELKDLINKKQMLSREKMKLIKKQGLSAFSNYKILPGNKQRLYEIGNNLNSVEEKLPGNIRESFIIDLMKFDPEGGLTTQWEFLHDSLKRVERGEIPFTWVNNDRLMACIWLKEIKSQQENANSQGKIRVLQGLYIYNGARGELGNFLSQIKSMVSGSPLNQKVYFSEGGVLKTKCQNLSRVYL